ncbi:MAG: fimbrillin family protein [Paludibacteraceae bacterium]|nr:fimbrillin family protein [Paludibacteraceae bacterium]
MRRTSYILLIVMAVLTMGLQTSCIHRNPVENPTTNADSIPMLMGVLGDQAASLYAQAQHSRGVLKGELNATEPNDHDGNQHWGEPWVVDDQFSTYAYYYYNTMTILGQQFMHDQAVDYDGTNWTYSPIKYWPNQGYLDLFAHYPSTAMLNELLAAPVDLDDTGLQVGDIPAGPSLAPASRAATLPLGLSSLRFWHENIADTTITFRYYCLPAPIAAPELHDMDNGIENDPPNTSYTDAEYQPDLMMAHRPHLSKPSVPTRVNYSFTHAMMGVRFWIKGLDGQDPIDPGSHYTKVRNMQDFTINSVSFGPVYSGGEVIAFDNTDWTKYYNSVTPGPIVPDASASEQSTANSTEPVKLRYLWNFGGRRAAGMLSDMPTPAYGGYKDKYDNPSAWPVNYVRSAIDQAYPITTTVDTYTQTCYGGLRSRFPWDNEKTDEQNWTAGNYPHTKTDTWWNCKESFPLMPTLDGSSADHMAFIIPPQFFAPTVPYIRVTFTMRDEDGSTLTHTLEARIPMDPHDEWWDATRGMLRVEDGQVLDIYFTFVIDGDDYFQFLVDAVVDPFVYGGGGGVEWGDW